MIEYVSKNEHGNCELKFKGETAEITQDVCNLISTVYAALLEKRNEVVAELFKSVVKDAVASGRAFTREAEGN